MKGQLLAIALVVIGGIATFVMMRSMYASLSASLNSYYENQRFANIFVLSKRAPESTAEKLREIEGIAAVETRVVSEVMLDVPDLPEPASATVVSVPESRRPLLNDLVLREGRWIRPGAETEVIASEPFCEANHLKPGSTIGAVINGRWRRLTIVGIGLSPEYVFEVGSATLIPDNKRYGILWMGRESMAAAYDMIGAFNSAAISLYAGASEQSVKERIDVIMKQYGSTGSLGRDEWMSHRFITDEIKQTEVSATIIPAIFLGVAVFLLNVSLLRLVSTQRQIIALLKSFGYSNASIVGHYIGFALVAVGLGTMGGLAVGYYVGSLLAEMYAVYYRFPSLVFVLPPDVLAVSIILSVAASVVGAISAVRSVVKLPPADAMRPESPKQFRPGVFERIPLLARLTPLTHIIIRNIERRPFRSAAAVISIGLATAILVIGRFMIDAVDRVITLQFNDVQRDDVTLMFRQPMSSSAAFDLLHLPGVMRAETFRAVGADIRHNGMKRRTVLYGVPSQRDLKQVVHADGALVEIPREGAVMTQYLARVLDVRIGDTVAVEILEGDRRTVKVPIVSTVDEILGTQLYLDEHALNGLMREQGSVSGGYLQVDKQRLDELYRAVKRTPAVAGVMIRQTAIDNFKKTYEENMNVSSMSIIIFACIIAFGVVYNNARIALSERGNELASLRVLGFTIGEIATVLLGEQVLLTVVAVPLGLVFGGWISAVLPGAFETEFFRIPVVFTVRNFGLAAGVTMLVTVLTGLLLYRRLKMLDLIAVLKTRE